ncbi:MAG: hypothetical protein OXN89_08370 [Bryobacterales bacterium]|nr:hypothetical protein [Bryobacterales bacterium]
MKIILSRKGFDSVHGRVPSPVFPDGGALSLPIPARAGPVRFRDVLWKGESIGPLVEGLTKRRVPGTHSCHLDPDLSAAALGRQIGWRPAFGQVGSAQGHLDRNGVGQGDVFLFFGWFRRVQPGQGGLWSYARNARSVHRLFGWLQVGEVLRVGAIGTETVDANPWLGTHPHVCGRTWPPNNSLYVAATSLDIDGNETSLPGAGLLAGLDSRLTLTDPAVNRRTDWRLPPWFWDGVGAPQLTYHRDARRWRRTPNWSHVRSVSKGQEFVFDAADVPQAMRWVTMLVREFGASADDSHVRCCP